MQIIIFLSFITQINITQYSYKRKIFYNHIKRAIFLYIIKNKFGKGNINIISITTKIIRIIANISLPFNRANLWNSFFNNIFVENNN